MKDQKYENYGFLYWNASNIVESRIKTYDDDLRRYNSLQKHFRFWLWKWWIIKTYPYK